MFRPGDILVCTTSMYEFRRFLFLSAGTTAGADLFAWSPDCTVREVTPGRRTRLMNSNSCVMALCDSTGRILLLETWNRSS